MIKAVNSSPRCLYLSLVDKKVIEKNILLDLGLEFGNFNLCQEQSGIMIDYNGNNIIELKDTEESFASAANYLNKIGWKKMDLVF